MMDVRASSHLQDNISHPLAPFIYSFSTMHCMTVSLALDGAGLPHIVHGDWDTDLLRHTWDDGTGWHTETVDHDVHAGTRNSLALDSAGRPHVSFREDHPAGFDDYLMYTYYDGATWLTETVDSGEHCRRAHTGRPGQLGHSRESATTLSTVPAYEVTQVQARPLSCGTA